MEKYISFGYFNKKYFLYVFYYFLLNVGKNLNLKLFTHFSEEIKSFIEDQPNIIIKVFNNSIGLSLCIIPEIIFNTRSRKDDEGNQKEKEVKKKFGNKKRVHTLINSVMILIYFSLDKYMVKEPSNLYYNCIIFIIFLFCISVFFFKNKYYKHQYFSLIGIIVLLLISYLFQNLFAKSFSAIVLLVNILIGISKSIAFGYSQLVMEKYYYSPYKTCYVFGMINSIISLVIYFIISHIPCNHDCKINYKGHYYFDNIYSFFSKLTAKQAAYVLIFHFLEVNKLILFNLIIEKYSLCHLFIPDLIISFFHIAESYYENEDVKNKDRIVKIFIVIITFFLFITEIFMSLIFIEMIELKFCGLNENIKINIEKRALQDIKTIKRKKKNSTKIVELNNYIVRLDNDNEGEEEEEEGEGEYSPNLVNIN